MILLLHAFDVSLIFVGHMWQQAKSSADTYFGLMFGRYLHYFWLQNRFKVESKLLYPGFGIRIVARTEKKAGRRPSAGP